MWSNRIGYPADFNYREYYRDIGYDLDQQYLEEFQYARGVRSPTDVRTLAAAGAEAAVVGRALLAGDVAP